MQEKKEKCTFAIRLLSISINSPVPDLVPIYYQLVSGGILLVFRNGGGVSYQEHSKANEARGSDSLFLFSATM